jgi:hypothetical protein
MRLLPAAVEIMLAVGDIAMARDLCEELSGFAARHVSDAVEAASAEASGDLSFAEGNLEGALPSYGRAAELWRDLHAPYRLSGAPENRSGLRGSREQRARAGSTAGTCSDARASRTARQPRSCCAV